MKVETSKLSGAALNYIVAICEDHQWRCKWMLEEKGYVEWQCYEQGWGNPTPNYIENWNVTGPIIQREGMTFSVLTKTTLTATIINDDGVYIGMAGRKEYLLAALRCYVTSKLGDEVDIPAQLCENM